MHVGSRFSVLFYLAGNFFTIKVLVIQNMCYSKNCLKSSLINDLQNKLIILQLRVLGLIGKINTGPWMKMHLIGRLSTN